MKFRFVKTKTRKSKILKIWISFQELFLQIMIWNPFSDFLLKLLISEPWKHSEKDTSWLSKDERIFVKIIVQYILAFSAFRTTPRKCKKCDSSIKTRCPKESCKRERKKGEIVKKEILLSKLKKKKNLQKYQFLENQRNRYKMNEFFDRAQPQMDKLFSMSHCKYFFDACLRTNIDLLNALFSS